MEMVICTEISAISRFILAVYYGLFVAEAEIFMNFHHELFQLCNSDVVIFLVSTLCSF